MSTQISDANSLVSYVEAFTGSSNDTEIKQCIYLAEFMMRNIELTANGATGSGPWIVYDRIGDRDIITDQMVENLYLKPINIPQVYRGKFGEVGEFYEFLPGLTQGDQINMYYYTTWPLLFSLEADNVTPVLNNVVLQSWPEGYVYGTLHNYYLKRKMPDDAAYWLQKFNLGWDTVEDQNNKGKWQGGHTRLTSIFQPRKDRRYTTR